ncbi:MAG: DUF3604 domain-containing protein [Pseudomonadota bacterium]
MKKFLVLVAVLLVLLVGLLFAAGKGWLGSHEGPGIISDATVPDRLIEARAERQADTAERLTAPGDRQILFGDLHVHTTLSFDAFVSSLPLMNGEGSHPLADACDFARFCSALDFWSINDHAEASTPLRWQQTVESIRQCNAVSGTGTQPDTVAFLGWEWTQVGATPDEHYGHKNVIVKGLADGEIPARPINSGGVAVEALGGITVLSRAYLSAISPGRRQFNFSRYVEDTRRARNCPPDVPTNELPGDCRESAETPAELFEKLDAIDAETIVIPHGTTWGFYTPAGSTWDKQLTAAMHDPERQSLVEVFSGHGNSEEYRRFRAAVLNEEGQWVCPEPSEGYLPSCWRSGEIVRGRCLADGQPGEACDSRAAAARQDYVNSGIAGHLTVGGETGEDWLDAGQCRDCFLPSFNYRPGGAVQYMLALRNFTGDGPERFRFGIMASSDNHRARPGTGYKEFFRSGMGDATGPRDERVARAMLAPVGENESFSTAIDPGPTFGQPDNLARTGSEVREVSLSPFQLTESERQASFFMTGGLIATHAGGRDRDAIWDAMQRREVYGTSGTRILLWFDHDDGNGERRPMGSEFETDTAPTFVVRAAGSFKQNPGCPDHVGAALTPERLDYMCRGECYNPSDERKLISRIEVVRILPQTSPDDDIADLIEDPWRTHVCEPDPHGCAFTFTDNEYPELARDAVYYVRAIESPSLAVNAGNVRCEYDENGECISVNLCHAGYKGDAGDDCLAPVEERAWSSPIFVDWPASDPP